ncbi:lys-63-specific deubiquitinase BRCC36-like [Haliotis cracherodii]|uniref:lys-63-specific deubiquitinase BRCC36-like n=1 Tax=Haliotis rufescens TaxID=6454 RepID=UPI001EAFEF09|nr:lys-63-specific deubiquitinase BRCC36-like [Haliotis rufescens]
MAVSCVHLEADAYLVCLTHALSTEREEVMGLLIGEVDERKVSHVSAVIMLRRSDKQADRVEISPEQLSDASTKAEDLAKELQRPMRVLGWYHSHPHITVWPSHVDVRTQASYQLMDPGFIGLIFSVFNEDKHTKQNRVQVTSFQSVSRGGDYGPLDYDRIEIPLHVVPSTGIGRACLESLVNLPKILSLEEQEAYQHTEQHDLDLLTKIHNAAVYTKSECHIMDVMGGPLLQSLENRLEMNKVRMEQLRHRKEEIKKRMKALATT